ncbi:MAG: DUF1080 domain-containing protein [Planctomycetia bacterium]|jgi:hypothetical protein
MRKAFTTFVILILLVIPTFAAEPAEFGLSLMHPGTFDGWNHGPKPITGWEAREGAFYGSADGVELLSGFSFDRSEIRLKWTVLGKKSKLQVLMPEVPTGKGLTLTLCEAKGCGQLTDGDTVLNPGLSSPSKRIVVSSHTLVLRRADGKITVKIDGKELYSLPMDTKRRFGLALFVEAGAAVIADIRASEPIDQTLFNGKDLTGWNADKNGKGEWVAKNGELVLKPGRAHWIRSIKDYENFTIAFDYKIKKGGNSGLAIRTPKLGWPSNDGMEMQIIDRKKSRGIEKDSLMSAYCNVPPFCRVDEPFTEDWNHIVLKTDGWMLSAWVNGQLVQQYNTKFHPELRYHQLRGWLGFQDHGRWVHYRNIKLREAPDGTGLKAWYAHPETNGAALLIDRLMNSEFLAFDHQIRSGVVSKHVDAPVVEVEEIPQEAEETDPSKAEEKAPESPQEDPAAPQETPAVQEQKAQEAPVPPKPPKEKAPLPPQEDLILADLTGPGVVTRIAIPKETEGTLAFYFDGEKKPRITCKPKDLRKVLPKINHTGSPLVAILCYEKSLKIVARGYLGIDSHIEYVTMPKEHPVDSFVSTAQEETGIPRGWRAPPEFRSSRIRKGTYHDYDPAKTVRTPQQTVYAGKSLPMIHFDGSGTVKYLMLVGDQKVLQSDDLWIEVTVDRRSKPSISMPARFWLPAFVKQGGIYNFVFRSEFGYASHIGIPFGDGITVSLRNRGKRKVMNVGLQASVVADETDPHGQPVGPMRLHAQYIPAGQDTDVFFKQQGKGRLIGVVLDAPEGATPGIAQLEIDSQPVPGWAAPDMSGLLGSPRTDFADMTSGNRDGIAWRYFLLAPLDFQKSIRLQSTTKDLPGRVILYYLDEK